MSRGDEASKNQKPAGPTEAYTTPRVVELGTLHELTHGGAPSGSDLVDGGPES